MNLLLVDDQIVVLEDIKRRVDWDRLGIDNLYTANSASEAKQIVQKGRIDILVTDIEMPIENGIALSSDSLYFSNGSCGFQLCAECDPKRRI